MKQFTSLVILTCFAMVATALSAQSITPIQLKKGRNAAYEWVNDYYINAQCDSRGACRRFQNLFADGKASIYNDYYPSIGYDFSSPIIEVQEYINLLKDESGFYNIKYRIKDAQILSEFELDGNILISIGFSKEISFVQKGNYQDSRYEYPRITVNLVAELLYDVESDNIVAKRIICEEPPSAFIILHEKDGNSISRKSTVESIAKNRSTPLIHYYVRNIPEDEKMLEIHNDTLKRYWGFGYGIGHEYVDAPINNSKFQNYNIDGGTMNNLFLKYYQQLQLITQHRLGLEIGVRYHHTKMVATSSYYDRYYSVDPDGGPYDRIVESTDYMETIMRNVVEMPITLKYDFFVQPDIAILAQVGGFVRYGKSSSSARGNMLYKGYYEWLYGVELDQNGIYDFGEYDITTYSPKYGIDDFSFGIDAAIGASYYFSNNLTLQAFVGLQSALWNKSNKATFYRLTESEGDWKPLTIAQDYFRTTKLSFNLQINYNF